jgi:multicomponent Na+:H+ antiporter subunit D
MEYLIGLLPFFLVAVSVIILLIPILNKSWKSQRLVELLSLTTSGIAVIMSLLVLINVVENRVVSYRFAGFKPPLGIVYTVDLLSSLLGFLSMTALFLTVLYSKWFIISEWKYLYYSLLFLLSAGSISCFYTGDIFNLFVSIELLSISAYGLVAFYRSKPTAIVASLRYAMTGIVATSIYFFAVVLIYSAFGTLNMADIALKLRNPNAITPFSQSVLGDIVLTSKIAFSLMVWVFLFKTGILPIGFTWQPHVYSEAPLPISAGFTAIADSIGIYLFMRFFTTILGWGVIEELVVFRITLFSFIQVLAIISAFISVLLMIVEKDIKKLITYSTISQFSLALLGITLDNVFGVVSAILLLISNILGDAVLFYLAGLSIIGCGRSINCIAVLKNSKSMVFSLVVAILNLFGVLPVTIGFWGKALLVLAGINKSITLPIIVLVVSGISAIGYFKLLHVMYTYKAVTRSDQELRNTVIPKTIILLLSTTLIVLGLLFTLYEPFRIFIINVGEDLLGNYREYIVKSIGVEGLI